MFFFKQKTAYEMRMSDWSSDVCSSDLARMALGEAITNLAAAPIGALDEVKLSANWMAATNHPGEDALLFEAVRALAMELCPALDLSIPVGKDSLSMQAQWQGADGTSQRCVATLARVISAFARVADEIGRAECRESGGQYVEV